MQDRRLMSGILAMGGGGLLVLGSLLPWAQVSSVFVTVSVNGTEGDGKITVGLGLVVAILGLIAMTNQRAKLNILAPILGLVAGAIGLLDLLSVNSKFGSISGSDLVHPSIGIGLYLVVLGGILTFVAALFGVTNKSSLQMKTYAENRIVPATPGVVIQKIVAWSAVVPGVVIETNGTTSVTLKDRQIALSITVLPVSTGSQVTTSGEASGALAARLDALWATVPPPSPLPPNGGDHTDDAPLERLAGEDQPAPVPSVNTYGF